MTDTDLLPTDPQSGEDGDDALLRGLNGERPAPKLSQRVKARTAGDRSAAYAGGAREPVAPHPTPKPEASVHVDITDVDAKTERAAPRARRGPEDASLREATTVPPLQRPPARWPVALAAGSLFGVGLIVAWWAWGSPTTAESPAEAVGTRFTAPSSGSGAPSQATEANTLPVASSVATAAHSAARAPAPSASVAPRKDTARSL